jgi:uncharacterized protein with PIN domain
MPRLLLTKELGRLARWLRILGFDAGYFTQNNPGSLIIEALRDNRIILTRNHRLPKSKGVKIVTIKAETLNEQIAEVARALGITPDAGLVFTRCIICNEELMGIDKEKIKDRVPEYVYGTQELFLTCPKCKRVYWQGTHWGNVQSLLKEVRLDDGIHS